MHILLIGAGGREHALAWKIAQSPLLTQLYTLPGNPGTAQHGINILGDPMDHALVTEIVKQKQIELVIVGPEAPLATGLADSIAALGVPVFGPNLAGAQMESSKAFSKDFMARHNIPTAAYETFHDLEQASAYLNEIEFPYVIKASGLAAGKGVFLPDTIAAGQQVLRDIMREKVFGDAGDTVVVEERITGPEVSVMAFTDGETLILMPPAQDHKRLLDHDQGPNTGGMGVFAPSPTATPEILEEAKKKIMQPAIDGLREEGIHYKGVLYGGLMLTDNGLKALEFNCRFGDPETQVVLPLLESDLVEIALACANGNLSQIVHQITWKEESAVCVVLASQGYPGAYSKGLPIDGLDSVDRTIQIFHAGTADRDNQIVTAGGRVLGVMATAESLSKAVSRAYQELENIHFEGMQYRSDIGKQNPAYAFAGVSIETGNEAMQMIRESVNATHNDKVLSEVGLFGGLYDASFLKAMEQPVLVSSTDGVGTKVKLAEKYGLLKNVGQDIVNHCVNDILVQGARPLFFLDYYATSKLDPYKLTEVIEGISMACKDADCALIGGETAEMPGVYFPGEFDLAGTIVGVVERGKMLPKDNIQVGDLLVGIGSTGPHTNGYSLIRSVFKDTPLEKVFPELGRPLGEALLEPHRSYLNLLWSLLSADHSPVKALAHLTGGGFVDNIPRVLPPGCGAKVNSESWPVLPIFRLIQKAGQISEIEMYHVFNMGIGIVAMIAPQDLETVQAGIPEETWVIGEVYTGKGVEFV
ncbi:MAG: phosphoribosylamine--glycine ligase [Anaerolineales bacterium]|nr:phosphoribosylamine--glycine ligase [Anaerolineales bacterium]